MTGRELSEMKRKHPTTITPGDYGPVQVISGRYRGRVGYYDNDEDLDRGGSRAVVYFDVPFLFGPRFIKHEYLVPTKVAPAALERLARHAPHIMRRFGIVRKRSD
jgi:hypothetical protein